MILCLHITWHNKVTWLDFVLKSIRRGWQNHSPLDYGDLFTSTKRKNSCAVWPTSSTITASFHTIVLTILQLITGRKFINVLYYIYVYNSIIFISVRLRIIHLICFTFLFYIRISKVIIFLKATLLRLFDTLFSILSLQFTHMLPSNKLLNITRYTINKNKFIDMCRLPLALYATYVRYI